MKQAVSLADKRRLFMERFAALQAIMLAASVGGGSRALGYLHY